DKFIKHFRNGGFIDLFEETFLQEVSLYIDDMRILKNIYNEFVVYDSHLREIELDHNMLLAIIAYKNIFLKYFSDLQLCSVFLHTLIDNKSTFVQQEIEKINLDIKRINEEIIFSKGENLESLDELDAIFLVPNYRI